MKPNFSLRKLLLSAVVAGPLAVLPAPLWALPDIAAANLTTSAGVTTQIVGTTLNVTSPDKAVLTWQAFGSGASTIGGGDTINYFLPSSTASVLNSVSGGVASQIDGKIISNGNVYILNPSGIVLGATANVNTAGFYASTVAEPSGFFTINGNLSFTGNSNNPVTVQNGAQVTAVGTGNKIFLVGKEVDVQGGSFFGNVFVKSTGTANSLAGGTASVSIGSVGNVAVSQVNVPATGGGLEIVTLGGAVKLSGAGTLAIAAPTAGALTVNTTGSTNGAIIQGAGRVTADATGSTVVLTAGGNGIANADINLGNVDFQAVGAIGKDVTVVDSDGINLNASTVSNNLVLTGGGGNMGNSGSTSVAGTVSLALGAGRTVSFSGTGNITFAALPATSTMTLTSTGDITLNQASITSTEGISITSSGGSILSAAGVAVTPAKALTLSATSSGGKISVPTISSQTGTVTAGSDITIGTALNQQAVVANVNTPTTVTSSGGNISVGAINATTTMSLTATAGSITVSGAVASATLNMTANAGSIALGANNITGGSNAVALSAGSITSTGTISSSTVNLTATTGSLSLGTVTATRGSSLLALASGGSITSTALNKTSTTGALTVRSDASLVLPTSNVALLVAESVKGSITQTAGSTINVTGTNDSRATLTAATDISLKEATNDFRQLSLNGGTAANLFEVVDANAVIVSSGTANAATKITGVGIQLGNGAGDSLVFGSTLDLTTTGAGVISTTANAVNIFGNVTLTTAGQAATLGNNNAGALANFRFGQVGGSLGAGKLTVIENTTLNLGNITAASIDASSLRGDIVNTGKLNLTDGAVTNFFAANSIFTPGSISLTNATNTIAGTVGVSNAANFSLVNAANTTVQIGTIANGRAVSGTTSVTVTGGTNTLTLSNASGGDIGIVSFSAPGNVSITETGTDTGLTLQNASASGGATTVTVTAPGPITLGSGIGLLNGGLTKITSTGAKASITDSAPNIRIFGPSEFISDNSISITNAGHSLGSVSLTTTGNQGASGTSNITYTEGGTANLNVVSLNSSLNTAVPNGSLTVVSTGGDVQQTAATGSIIVRTLGTGTPTVSFTSTAGLVNLSNPAGTNAIANALTLSAVGNSSIVQSGNTLLGNVAVTAGTLSINTSAGAGTVTQNAGTSVKAFGETSVTTASAKITLTNTGNNFGGLKLASNTGGGADIAVTEAGTINFLSVNTGTGKLAATSETAGIIQSGTTNLGLTVGGATTLTAGAAGISLNTSTTNNNFGGQQVKFTTIGNVTVQDSNAVTVLQGDSTIGGSLIIKNNVTGGAGEIKDSPGTLTVSGNVLFDTTTSATSKVNIGSSTASLGAIQFRSGTVTIVENATLNVLAGSVASGDVSLTSSGNIVTSGSGGGTFQKKLDLNASGSITITNPIFVNGSTPPNPVGLTFRALGAVDLSALSLAGNLNSITPTNLGASSYKAPSP